MTESGQQKVSARHLGRDAYLYVRQSTMQQVFENTESTARQYELRERAAALGWPQERIVVIDTDLGQSGASAADREGFQRLVTEVGMARAGIVLGLEVSRLARNSADWHRLLEICALTDTLILDEDGLYDPTSFNDRLLLGLKGTMSEAELHVLRARLRGGILNKARRGQLELPLPTGLVYSPDGRVVLDPDTQVQDSVRLFFRTFRRVGSAHGIVKTFREQGVLFPLRLKKGPRKGELVWRALQYSRTLAVLHNPRYAGAYCFGRIRTRKRGNGERTYEQLRPEEWHALLWDAHDGYIARDEFEENQRRLLELAQAHGCDRRKGPPREGPALLQGLVVCGICGERMTVAYHSRNGTRVPQYKCARKMIEHAKPICQSIPGQDVDEAVGALLVDAVSPESLELALAVQEEIRSRLEEADRLRKKCVERARYEADLAERRYRQVDPANRLVAASLEAEWNGKLRVLAEVQGEYERRRGSADAQCGQEQRDRILSLATEFRTLWRDPRTPDRERKRMARLVIEDVTLIKRKEISLHVRFKGGATRGLTVPAPLQSWQIRQTPPAVVAEINRLVDHHTDMEIARILNERGTKSGQGRAFRGAMIARIREQYGLGNRHDRLRAHGMLTLSEFAEALGVTRWTVLKWQRRGHFKVHAYNDKHQCLYEPPSLDDLAGIAGRASSPESHAQEVTSDGTKEA